uniref:Vacuolar protein sorting-associated protein 33B n=1 Tax=Glossina pallidipes TaxID=7398 RepID=A0A1B0A2I8_GLOPL
MEVLTIDKKLQGLQLIAQEKLQTIICSIPGRKDLILEPSLIKPLEHICAASWLKLKGIQRIFKLDATHAISRSAPDQVQLYMLRSDAGTFQRVMAQIKVAYEAQLPTWPEDSAFKYFHMICVPACFAYFHDMLEQEGLYGIVGLHRFSWDFIYLDKGVLSLEIPNVFATTYVNLDNSLLTAISQSLRILQAVCGKPDLVLTYGERSDNILKMLQIMGPLPRKSEDNDRFTAILMIDRDKDYAAPLLTPSIYAGLLMEVFTYNAGVLEFGINTNKIVEQKLPIFAIPTEKQNKPKVKSSATDKPSIIRLNSQQDEIYSENRYKHFIDASSQIRAQAKLISLELQKLSNMKLDEMQDYVNRKLPKITELKNKLLCHLNASEKLIEMLGTNYRRTQALEEDILNNHSRKRVFNDIDELLTTDPQRYNSLRLLCLLHIWSGVTTDELIRFIRNYCNYFGHKYAGIFDHLAQAGLLPQLVEDASALNRTASKLLSNISLNIPKFQQTAFQANAYRLKLMTSSTDNDGDNGNETLSATPSTSSASPSYVFNRIYIPLIAQLCTYLLKANNTEDFASKVAMIEHIKMNGCTIKLYNQSVKQGEVKELLPLNKLPILVYVVGGVTYAEISACNMVAKLTESQIVVASDCILAGSDLISSAF